MPIRAGAPPIPSLSEVPYLTNETIFSIDALPTHLIILGAGAIGLRSRAVARAPGIQATPGS
ncbi:MAG: hypothetical protein IPG56_20265 [Caulobacteraceae bacterium]|nr:hypothetical protein [Caulobacteraceae bacterium]